MTEWLPLLKTLVLSLCMPVPLGCVLLGFAALFWLARWRRLAGGLVALAFAFPILLAWQPVAETMLAGLEKRHADQAPAEREREIKAIVVLGAGFVPRPGRPLLTQLTAVSALRLMEGIRLAGLHPHARLIVTGGTSRTDLLPVAVGYARAAEEFGVYSDRIIALPEPLNTAQEARAVSQLLSPSQGFFLVTSASHMPRAVAHFRRVGLNPIPAQTEYLSGRDRLTRDWLSLPAARHLENSERALIEYLGLLALPLEYLE